MSLLEAGDVVLTFSGAIESWWLALCGDRDRDPNGLPYTHAEVLFRDSKGHWMLGGVSGGRVRSRRLEHALQEFQHIAIYRARQPQALRHGGGQCVQAWVNDPQFKKASFDYTLQDVPGRRDRFSCVGFINEACRTTDLPTPFLPSRWNPNAAGHHLGEILGFDFDTVFLVDSVFKHPDYDEVLEWQNEFVDDAKSEMLEAIVKQVLLWYEEGWQLKTSYRWNLALQLAPIPSELKEIESARTNLRNYTRQVLRAWRLAQQRRTFDLQNETAVDAAQNQIFLKYRSRYFEKVYK